MVGSFLLAGARSVVASLWQVDDRSTSVLMKHFYSYLSKGEGKSKLSVWPTSTSPGNIKKMLCRITGPGSRFMEIACGPSQALKSETRKWFSTAD
jgi:CHAT domain